MPLVESTPLQGKREGNGSDGDQTRVRHHIEIRTRSEAVDHLSTERPDDRV
jgi:hypothetical protein